MDGNAFKGVAELAMVGMVVLVIAAIALLVGAVALPILALYLEWHPSTLALCCQPAGLLLWLWVRGARR